MSDDFLPTHQAGIARAAHRIAGRVRRTAVLPTDLDPGLLVKPENLQVTGSFKARGAFNAVLSLRERVPEVTGVIAVSSGNHAQALALAAREAGLPATIVIPADANPAKVAATTALGAEVIQEGVTFANREERMREVMAARGLTLIHPFDDWDVIHGQGTAAREILEDRPEVGVLAVPTGGGGLLSGTALAAHATDPSVRVIGVEPEQADDATRSFATGELQRLDEPPVTIADGVRAVAIGERNFEVIVRRRLVHAMVTVSEAEIENALVVGWTRLHLAIEPTGALPLAAFLAGKLPPPAAGRTTAVVLSGGNADLRLVSRLLAQA